MDLTNLVGLVDTGLLDYTEEAREGINRARLIQGDSTLEKDKTFKNTVRYYGGIGLSTNGLKEEVLSKAETVMTLDSGDYAVFKELEVVVLASARVRRFFTEVDGQTRLACGTNQDGANAVGWRGINCHACEFHPKNYQGKKQDACGASVTVLVYFPELDHTAILELRGASYMAATHWLQQVGVLSKAFAQKPEMQAAHPGLARVNGHFFKTKLFAGPHQKGNDNNTFQVLEYTKAAAPYDWDAFLNEASVIVKATNVLNDMQDAWKGMYIDSKEALPMLTTAAAQASQTKALPPGGTVTSIPVAAQAPGAPEASAEVLSTQTSIVDLEDDDEDVAGQNPTEVAAEIASAATAIETF